MASALPPTGAAPIAGADLPYQLLNDGARRLAWLALSLAISAVVLQLFQRLAQPQIAPVMDDPVNRLVGLAAVLMAIGVFSLERYRVVTARTLLGFGAIFEIVVAFAISMVETSRPFDAGVPLLGLSAVAPWIVFVGAVIPSRPNLRLTLALAAATTWPVAYWLNSVRFGFVTESWRQVSVWPVMNYLFAVLAYMVGRLTYGTARKAQTVQDLGSYRLEATIGEGGMGEVWRASHKMLARPAAIKLVKPDSAEQQDLFTRRFHREANVIAGLQSPHTVYLYDFGTTQDGRLYYVMELLDGISLQTLVTMFGPQPSSRVVSILRQICRSLEEAHAQKLIHRDLKPSNVMICKVAQVFDFVKVLDFGLAKPFGGTGASQMTQLTVQGVTTGTPGYMAPEVALGTETVDARADLYALGCVGYVLLTGTLVFPDANPMSMALKHVRAVPDPPSRRTDVAIPPDLERVILSCLEKNPSARPAGAREVAQMLDACAVPAWSDSDATAWWDYHLPATSPLRSFAQPSWHTPPVVQKV